MRKPLVPELSIAERNRHWAAVRDLMALRNLDALVVWGGTAAMDNKTANVRYLTNLGGNVEEVMCIMPLEGGPLGFVQHPARVQWWEKVQTWTESVGHRAGSWAETAQEGLRKLGITSGRIGIVGLAGPVYREGDMTYETMVGLQELLQPCQLVNATDLMEEVRMIKSAEEIDFLRRAGAVADAGLQAILNTARPGVFQEKVYAQLIAAMIEACGEYATMTYWDCAPFPSIHPGRGPWHQKIETGDMITTEFHSKYGGYMAHVERAFSIGRPRPEFQHIFDVSLASYQSGVKKIRDGATVGEVAEAFRQPISDAGLVFTECGLHGHGLETGEYPMFVFPPGGAGWGGYFPGFRLRAGMVFGIVIDVRDAKWKNDTGLMFGDTVLVTHEGCERLCKFPLELHQV